MKQRLLLFALCLQALFLSAQNDKNDVRTKQLFNFDWKFQPGNVENAAQPGFDDTNWRILDLPHDFQIEQPWIKRGNSQRGYKELTEGWYRKSFHANPQWKDKKVLLDIEGVVVWGEVWCNGEKVAEIDFGYLGCEIDLSKYLKYDQENLIAVFASTKGNSRWYTGGGLFRDVHLIIKEPISIARHGIFISTPSISEQQAKVSVQVEVEGITGKSLNLMINAQLFSPDGERVAETSISAPKGSKLQTVEVPLPLADIAHPLLWSCETPHLYTAEVSLVQDGKIIDRLSETFGIRSLEFSPEFGFKLNGKKVFLKGMANHHDLGAVGAAAYDYSIERLFKRMKEFGYNHIRTSHNPYSESFMRLADKYGILVVDEWTDKWSDKAYWPGRKPFTQLWYTLIPEWIKRDRNHPSVILWSLGNELQMREDLAGFPTGDWGITTYRILDILTKRYDPTRKTTVAMYPSRANAISRKDAGFNEDFTPPELSLVTEVASFNYQFRVYPKYLEQAPHLNIYQSEATTNDLLQPYFGMNLNKMIGIAYWGAVEYWGESNGWPKKGWNFSFFNHALEPNPEAYLIQSAFSEEPLVHIGVIDKGTEELEWNDNIIGRVPTSSHWNREKEASLNLFTYTNADEVELLVNGRSVGIQKNNRDNLRQRNTILWKDIPYQAGKVTAIGRNKGREMARHQLETTGKATALKMEVENEDWKAGGMDLQYVKVYAVDSKGRVVPNAEGEVAFDVSGHARILAVDNGDHFTDKVFSEGNTISLHNGFAMVILRSGQTSDEVKVKASVKGLKSAERKMKTK